MEFHPVKRDVNNSRSQHNEGIIIQARMGSTRLPGKVLMDFCEGQTILDILLKTISKSGISIPIILATGNGKENQPIVSFCKKNKIPCFVGEEENVLQRLIDCADFYKIDYAIRICADNPFLDSIFLQQLYQNGQQNLEMDYAGFKTDEETPAIRSHWGLFTEWVKVKALKETADFTQQLIHQEHVTNFLYQNPEKFNLHWLRAPESIWEKPQLRFTIDSLEDFKNMQYLYTKLKDANATINSKEIIEMAYSDPAITSIMNAQIKQYTK